MQRSRSNKLSDLVLLLLMLVFALGTWSTVSDLKEEVNSLTTRVTALEVVPEKTLEIVVEREWDRKNARYFYKLDKVKETIHDSDNRP